MTTPNFDFGPPYGRQPVTLGRPYDGIAEEAWTRINATLSAGCYCHHDQERSATLRRRMGSGGMSVYLQCEACGEALGPAFARRHFTDWQALPMWDDTLQPLHEAAAAADNAEHRAQRRARADLALAGFQQHDEARLAELRQRQADYRTWCRSSPEWAAIHERVMWRSRGWCEACLVEKAGTVHHLTYKFGVLPPAWPCVPFAMTVCIPMVTTGALGGW
jgi:hypothetical protein